MTEESELYLKIKKMADKQKISMLTLNDRAKLGTNAIYRWRNQTPGTDKIKKVADVLGVSVDYLLGNTDEMMPNKNNVPSEEKLDEALDRSISYDGKEITDHDRRLLKAMLASYFENKDDNAK